MAYWRLIGREHIGQVSNDQELQTLELVVSGGYLYRVDTVTHPNSVVPERQISGLTFAPRVQPIITREREVPPELASDDMINRVLRTVGELHDGGALWEDYRRNSETFRQAVRQAIMDSAQKATGGKPGDWNAISVEDIAKFCPCRPCEENRRSGVRSEGGSASGDQKGKPGIMANPPPKIIPETHLDHALTPAQIEYVADMASRVCQPGQVSLATIDLPERLGTAPCALYGPIMGDPPQLEIQWVKRGTREYTSRTIQAPLRPSKQISIITGPDGAEPFVVYTMYGGPIAPREPDDTLHGTEEHEKSMAFWNEHALATPPIEP